MAQKYRMAIAIVVLTEEPLFWQKDSLCEFVGSRVADIQAIEVRSYGIPVTGTENDPVKIEFDGEPTGGG